MINDKYLSKKYSYIYELNSIIPISQITNTEYVISFFWDKIFNTGTIKIYTAGSNSVDLRLEGVEKPVEIYKQIQDLIHREREIQVENTKPLITVKPEVGIATFMDSLLICFFSLVVGTVLSITIATGLQNFFRFSETIFLFVILFLISLIIFITVFVIILIKKQYERKTYDFYEDRLEYYDGFLTLKRAVIPYERITNIGKEEPFWKMAFGVADININTAGKTELEVVITSISNGDKIIEELRKILNKNGRN